MAGKAGGELSSASGSSIIREGFVGVVGDSSSSVVRELLCCVGSVGNHVRRKEAIAMKGIGNEELDDWLDDSFPAG